MVKRIFIVHRWNGNSNSDWYTWIKCELEKRPGFNVKILNMPNSEKPDIDEWVGKIRHEVSDPNDNVYFIGHSIGCQAILRYLETIDRRIGGCVFVSGWIKMKEQSFFTDSDKKILRPWNYLSINIGKILANCKTFISIFSENDPYVSLENNIPFFKNELNSKIVIMKDHGHFTSHDNIKEFPDCLYEILNVVK